MMDPFVYGLRGIRHKVNGIPERSKLVDVSDLLGLLARYTGSKSIIIQPSQGLLSKGHQYEAQLHCFGSVNSPF